MPVQILSDQTTDNLYCHVYNKGIDDNIIFKDEGDCKIFLSFINEYLTTPTDAESSKKDFNIRGKVFRGTPHQIKNYFGKIELIAYSLSPDHFHLLLNLKHKDHLAGFIRSLCTRYSIYFNKKYTRNGSLFAGPYKSVNIKNEEAVLHLTRFLHTHGLSSYPEYLGTRLTPWVNTQAVLDYIHKYYSGNSEIAGSYKYFVERYKPNQNESKLIESITFENKFRNSEYLQPAEKTTNQTVPTNLDHKKFITINIKHRIPEYIAINTVFFFLLTLGVGNISAPKNIQYTLFSVPVAKNIMAMVNPSYSNVLGINTKSTSRTEDIKDKSIISISIKDGSESIDIYKDKNIESDKIGNAKNGAVFELMQRAEDWYQIKLPNDSVGYVLSKYINIEGGVGR